FGKWDPQIPPTCLNQEEFSAVSKQQNSSQDNSSSSSIVGVIVGLAIGFAIVSGVLFYLLWHIRHRRRSSSGKDVRTEPTTKGEQPMVVFPTSSSISSPIPSNNNNSSYHSQSN